MSIHMPRKRVTSSVSSVHAAIRRRAVPVVTMCPPFITPRSLSPPACIRRPHGGEAGNVR